MNKKRRLLRAGSILAVALAAGYVTQTWNAEKLASAKSAPRPVKIETVSAGPTEAAPATAALPPAASLATPAAAPAMADLTTLLPKPVAKPTPETPAVEMAALTTELPPPPVTVAAEPAPAAKADPAPAPSAAPAADCTPDLSLTAGDQAMIAVRLSAPCAAGQRVVLRHAGLAVAESLDDSGLLTVDLPALNTRGEVSVLFADASVSRDAVPVPAAANLRRFAVQWMADDAFDLHAYEDGADFGTPGHVSAGNPVSPTGGYLVSLGDAALDLPMLAQVYTWPADAAHRAEVVVEAPVTAKTCARELLGETILADNGTVTVTDLTLAMPECDAQGDILVLNNLLPDMTLAAAN